MKNYILLLLLLVSVAAHAQINSVNGNYTSNSSANLSFYAGPSTGTLRMRVLSGNGFVGIGNLATPLELFHVNGSARATRLNTTGGIFGTIGATNLSFYTNGLSDGTGGTSRMTILNTNGFVGINQATPTTQLHVGGSALFQYTTAPGTTSVEVDNGGIRGSIESVIGGPVGTVRVGSKTNYTLSMITNSITRMTVLTDGKVGIGTSSPAYPLDVNGIINATGLYVGGVPFIGSNWTLASGNVTRSTGNVGIGTSSPAEKLHVEGGNILLNNATPVLYTGTGSSELNRFLRISNSAGLSTPSGVKAGGALVADDYDYASPGKNDLVVKGAIGIGTPFTSNPNAYKLAVNGKIGAKDLQIETSSTTWPDYVFEKSYNLPALSKVEKYVQENKHLEGMPSAAEVKEKGYSVNELNEALLKKVEELTLYVIEQQKQINELKKEVSGKKRKK